MLLAIDIGNTNVVLGVFGGTKLVENWRVSTKTQITPDEYAMIFKDLFNFAGLEFGQVEGVIISTVVPPLLPVMTEMCRKYFRLEPLVVTYGLRTGITIRYDNPKEIGADRIVNAAAAYSLYGGPLIIIDFGTATTFCALTGKGEYLGGAISPGIKISAEALFQRASKLPRVELAKPPAVIGSDTISAMQAGVLFGYAGLVDGIVERMKRELSPDARVVATGGLAELVAPETRSIQEIRPHLTLEGLRMLYEMNR
ncbi:MAG: pantothenate kinase [Nitrospirae bacterium GWC2_57_13]|jgi:type III pantothenate kinase|nr:MAG: pantothenate kinase [Nitrospirae bacterium GWC1_57_7]OGW27608.1 MAG: pantothenate kinase [Nitrospirae bacterium GWC2_57_13]HAR45814.1 type III pantothenate kinase [Nitrospiraceae bacterium]HAS54982.1 type III pantothenate kinase [Nitrospiraceae bacterium]